MKYKLYITDSIETLENEKLIGEADSFSEARQKIVSYLDNSDHHQEPYWRYLMAEHATCIDFGSWTKFVAIIPPVSTKEMMS
jgi:hypothetical protein